ncbi:hypothetical protein Clacol_001833 [Clathrus columnatus]|uniref:Translational machinery component n=1 Tax=Clathrus columnatus TaxID=1419009 RepID=A0AAV5A4E5_9AGAM|nr:hypothetical protein Clacol_001833 [Clathrus columnatus]
MLRPRFAYSLSLFRPRYQHIRTYAIPPVRNTEVDSLIALIGANPTPTEQTSAQTEDDIPSDPPRSQEYSKTTSVQVSERHGLPSSGVEDRFQLYVHASSNNTIITFSTPTGRVLSVISGGMCGFKKVQRSTYEAGYRCAVHIFEKIAQVRKDNIGMTLQVNFKGFGQGREAVYRALTTSEGESVRDLVKCISDRTPIKIGGTKAKKRRRL